MALLDKINYLTLPNKISVQTSSQSAAGVQNWKDGSSSGSVRTVGSSVQDTEYKIGQYAVTEGSNTKAQGQAAHAEGTQSTANGNYSHAEGSYTQASGTSSHAEGFYTQASGTSSHAEGIQTKALGSYSHVEGIRTKSTHAYQHVFGAYNKLDSSSNSSDQKGTYIEIVGNGTSNNLTNARTLDWQGNETLSGKLTAKEIFIKTESKDRPSIEADGEFIWFTVPYLNVTGSVAVRSDHSVSSDLLGTLSHGFYRYYEIADVNGITWYQIVYNYTTPGWVAESSYVFATHQSQYVSQTSISSWNTAATWVTNNRTAALTDNKVTQNNTSSNGDYRVLLSGTVTDTDITTSTNKSSRLIFNPSTKKLTIADGTDTVTLRPTLIQTSGTIKAGESVEIGSATSNGSVTIRQAQASWADPYNLKFNSVSSRYMAMHGVQYSRMYDSGTSGTTPATSGSVNNTTRTSNGYYASNNTSFSAATKGSALTRDDGIVAKDGSEVVTHNSDGLSWEHAKGTTSSLRIFSLVHSSTVTDKTTYTIDLPYGTYLFLHSRQTTAGDASTGMQLVIIGQTVGSSAIIKTTADSGSQIGATSGTRSQVEISNTRQGSTDDSTDRIATVTWTVQGLSYRRLVMVRLM